MQADDEERGPGHAEREVRVVGVGGHARRPTARASRSCRCWSAPQRSASNSLSLGRDRASEAGDEGHEVALRVDLTRHSCASAAASWSSEPPGEVSSRASRTTSVTADAAKDGPGSEARVLGVRHHLLDRVDDVAARGVAEVLGRSLLEHLHERVGHRSAAGRGCTAARLQGDHSVPHTPGQRGYAAGRRDPCLDSGL